MAALSSNTIFETNPYEGHPSLTNLEAEVLWQYAKLAQNVKEVSQFPIPRPTISLTWNCSYQ